MTYDIRNNGLGHDLADVRMPLSKARHVPGYVYSSPEVLDLEKRKMFLRDWLYAGRVEELENPGDYMAMRVFDEPILMTRDTAGKVNVFYNMCVHRGVEVATGQGNTRNFKCPYHGWVYDLTGKLAGATYMKESEGFDPANCRMKTVQHGIWAGNIFITFNPDPQPLEEYLREFITDFSFLRMEDCRLANKIVLEVDCNWKFVCENLMDFYHVRVLHANTFGAKFSWDADKVNLKEKGGITIFYNAGPPTPGAQPLLGKMPWLEDKPESFASIGFLSPNLTIFGRIDCVRPMLVWPVSPDKCRFVIYHLFPRVFFDRPDFKEKLKIYHDYQIMVLEEDRSMIQSMQQAMHSRSFDPGRMSTLEKPLHHYMNGYLDRVFGPEASHQEAAQ